MTLVDRLICEFISNVRIKNLERCDELLSEIMSEKRRCRLEDIAKSLN